MWFRQQGQSVDAAADGFRVSLKNRMRRFRSPEKNSSANSNNTASLDQFDPTAVQSADTRLTKSTDDAALDQLVAPKSSSSLPPPPPHKKPNKNDKDKASAAATLLTDRKFKNNRIVKSSSKGKVSADMLGSGETASGKGRSTRKISSPPILETGGGTQKVSGAALAAAAVKKHVRSHSNLNLNALLRYKLTNKKQLSQADFDRIRRKSLSGEQILLPVPEPTEVVTTESDENVKDASQDDDATPFLTDVVVIETSQGDDGDNVVDKSVDAVDKDDGCYVNVEEDDDDDEDAEDVFHKAAAAVVVVVEDAKLNKKSPSLGARVAARFSESATARAKKAKQKKRKNSRGSTLYQQNSFV